MRRSASRRSALLAASALRLIIASAALCGIAVVIADAGAADRRGAAQFQSTSDYVVLDGNRRMTTIRVYVYDQGLYIWPENLLPLLGVGVEQNPETGAVTFHLHDGRMIVLEGNYYTKDGTSRELGGYDVMVRDHHVLVGLDFLNHVLPKEVFLANRADRTISISDGDCTQSGQWCRMRVADCDAAEACLPLKPGTPSLRSYVYDSTEEAASKATPSETPPPAVKKPEQLDTLILQPHIKMLLPPNGDYLEVLDGGDMVFLPLNDVVQLFGFPVKIDKSRGTASGYMFSPEHRFDLDTAAKRMQVGDQKFPVSPQDVIVKDGEIYISTDAFARWFDVESSVDRKQQSINFQTPYKLPAEEDAERRQRWQKLLSRNGDAAENIPVLENPYKLIDYPVLDVNLSGLINSPPSSSTTSLPDFSANYNVQGAGDVGYATGRFYISGGTTIRGVDTLRLTAGRKDPDARLLGPLHATDFALGDITSPSVTLVTANSIGRGLTLTNRSLQASENFDVRSFSGDSVPGYQAELYRNGELVAFQTVGGDGRYNFNNVQVLFGENVFRIVLYGPQGQKEERVETIEASASFLKANELEYTFGVDQRGVSLIPGIQKQQSEHAPIGLQAVAQLRYGITSYLTAGAFAASTALKDSQHSYYGFSLAGTVSTLQAETNFVRDAKNNGWAAGATAMTSIYGVNLRAYYRQYQRFASESVNASDTPLSSEMGFDTSAQALLPLLGPFSYGVSATRQTFENPLLQTADTFTLRVAKSVAGLGFTNAFYFADNPTRTLQDTFSLQTRLADVDVRLSGIYQFEPYQGLQDLNLAVNYLLTERLSGQTQVDTGPATGGTYSFAQTLYWDFDDFRLGFSGRMDTNGIYSAGFNLTFSLARNPVTGRWLSQPKPFADSGAVAGRVYVKQDDAGDATPNPQDARVVVDNATIAVDPVLGYLVGRVMPYHKMKVSIDPNSIADPLLSPENKAFNVITRPGSTVLVDFPLVMTTTIEGNLFILDALGKKQPVKEAIVELEDKDGKVLRRGITEFDGYFSFDKVGAGRYRLGLPPEVLKELKATIKVQPQVNIDTVTEFISNRDIVLAPAD